ncbi:cation:dicarboxylase symporter family transporter [candidate division KSB1 bacterium]|nr:cation:dicarboxylase symporter family transporter [candidate division KSB1 bacterium]
MIRSFFKRLISLKLHWQIFIALALGVIAGVLTGEEKTFFNIVTFYSVFDFLGALFLRALKMIIVPLITSSIITGVSGVGSSGSLGKIGGKTFLYYVTTSMLAILVGLMLVNIITPGIEDGSPVRDKLGLTADTGDFKEEVTEEGADALVNIFLRMIPTNPISSAVEGDILPIIFFCLLFGYFITKLPEKYNQTLNDFWQAVFEVMMQMTGFVMKFAPIGVFGLIARIVASTGFEVFGPLALYFTTVLSALAIHFLVTLPLLLMIVAKVNPIRHYNAMAPALLTAFSTSSSSATLPLTMECVEKRAGVSNRVTSFVLPLGATVNMDGTALYECVAAMFIAQAYGIGLTVGQQFIVVITALLASIGAAGIPSAGLVMITIILKAIGLPLEGVGLILAVDRILDMCRTTVNVFSDSCGTVIIAKTEGETNLLTEPIQ